MSPNPTAEKLFSWLQDKQTRPLDNGLLLGTIPPSSGPVASLQMVHNLKLAFAIPGM
jgi:hypothetical protein